MFKDCRTTTEKGNIGEAYAIAHFTKLLAIVSKPLFPNSDYDLVVELDNKLNRVQVKTTEQFNPSDTRYMVNLKTSGSNARVNNTRPFDPKRIELLFVLADNGTRWVIPTTKFTARHSLTLSEQYDAYIIKD